MADIKPVQDILTAAVTAKGPEDPETASIKRILKLLDKTAKSNRTYGSANPVAQKFSQQLFQELTGHLHAYSKLTFLVQRSELRYNDSVVYQTDMTRSGESFAFKLYADGIRELSFYQGLSYEDMMYFLDSLWEGSDPNQDDDDIVTRLWSRNLQSISIVTAEEVAKSSAESDNSRSLDGVMSSSDATLRDLLDRERRRRGRTGQETGGREALPQNQRFQVGQIGYEVTQEELAALASEIEKERRRDSLQCIMDMLTAILASEESPALLTKLFSVWNDILDLLFREGKWTALVDVVELLQKTAVVRPDLSEEHRRQVASLLNGIGSADRLKAIETYLNRTPNGSTEGLSTILLMMKPEAVPGLCALLANLESTAHQAIVSDALFILAKDRPQPLIKGLVDRRPAYVRNLLAILMKWNDPKFAEPVEKLARYPDAAVRKEVVRALGLFRPGGNGVKFISFLDDGEESVRVAALKLLLSGQYTVAWSSWLPVVSANEFGNRPISERRAIYQAIRVTCGDEAVPYWEGLLTEWSWTNRKKKEELAILAAETLGKLGTPAAISALERGAQKGGAAVRQACAHALSQAQRRLPNNHPARHERREDPL